MRDIVIWKSLFDCVIRPADKGSGIAVMDTQDYVTTLNDEMANNTTYKQIATDNSTTV